MTVDVPPMAGMAMLPHGQVLLKALAVTPERLRTGSKVAVSLSVLRAIINTAVSQLPFNAEFYRETYPDIREAYEAGRIGDLHRHFIETGYLEGRLGTSPKFDEAFYLGQYPDVVAALANGEITSALDHYIRDGVFEGRHANATDADIADSWSKLSRPF